MNNIKNYFTIFLCIACFWTLVSQVGLALENFHLCEFELKRARTLIESTTCLNSDKRAMWSKECNDSENIVRRPLLVCTLLKTANQLKLCPEDSCHIFATNVTNQLPKIMFVVTITLFLLFWLSGSNIRQNYKREQERKWALPHKLLRNSYKID